MREAGGVNEAAEDRDVAKKTMSYTKDSNVEKEARERKDGGRMKRKSGGKTVDMMGDKVKMHAGRKPRKSGGSCESNPFSNAGKYVEPKGHKTENMAD